MNPDKMQNQIKKYKITCGPSNIYIFLNYINICVRLLAHMDKRKLSLGLEISDQIWILNFANQKRTEEDIKACDNEGLVHTYTYMIYMSICGCVACEMYDILIWWLYIHTYICSFTSSLPYLFLLLFVFGVLLLFLLCIFLFFC